MKFGMKIFALIGLMGLVVLGIGCFRSSAPKQDYQKLAPAPAPQKAPVIPEEASKIPRPF